jgi:hypothetical protein
MVSVLASSEIDCGFEPWFIVGKWDDDEVRFVLDQYTELEFYSASSLKQQFMDRHVATLWHIILITSQPVFA